MSLTWRSAQGHVAQVNLNPLLGQVLEVESLTVAFLMASQLEAKAVTLFSAREPGINQKTKCADRYSCHCEDPGGSRLEAVFTTNLPAPFHEPVGEPGDDLPIHDAAWSPLRGCNKKRSSSCSLL